MPLPALSAFASNIEIGPEGFWVAPSVSAVSYPEDDNAACFAVEDTSFWFAHRNQCIVRALRSYPPRGPVFDIGGGNGYVSKGLQDAGFEAVVVEPGLAGARNAVHRGLAHVVRATLQDAGFFPATLPAAGLFDVVEHIQHDRAFLSDVHRYLVPGGRVYLTVPAFPWLWSLEDVEAGHWRRYTRRSMGEVFEQVGFQVEFSTYFFGFLVPAVFGYRTIPFRMGFHKRNVHETSPKSHQIGSPLARAVLERLMRREQARIAGRRPMRLGSSCLVVARKPDS